MDSHNSNNGLCAPSVQCRIIPLLLLASFTSTIVSLLTPQLTYERFARNNGLDPTNTSFQNSTACLKNFTKSENELQDKVEREFSQFSMYTSIAMCVSTALCMPIWGAYSDIVGRKLPIVVGCTGNVLKLTIIILVVALNWPLWIMIIGEVVHGLCGNSLGTIGYTAYAYVVDNTCDENRNLQLVLVDVWVVVGTTASSIIAGFTVQNVGYVNPSLGYILPLSLVSVVQIIIIFYTVMLLPKFGNNVSTENQNELSINHVFSVAKRSTASSIKLFISPSSYRSELSVLACIFLLMSIASVANYNFLKLYVMGYPLCWRALKLSIFTSIQTVVNGVACLVVTYIWQKTRRTQECLLVMGFTSCVFEFVLFGLARESYIMYLDFILGCLTMLAYPIGRSLAAEPINEHSQGALMAGISSIQYMAFFIGSIVLNYIYVATVSIYEGLIFFIGAGIIVGCHPLVMLLYKIRKSKPNEVLLQNEH